VVAASGLETRVAGAAVSGTTAADDTRERAIIEAALAETRGRVSGPRGAAARLRMAPSTLDFRIKKLHIRKSQFKIG
jgi:transcriptional regulator with GAF, ATPase, and Fis domain